MPTAPHALLRCVRDLEAQFQAQAGTPSCRGSWRDLMPC